MQTAVFLTLAGLSVTLFFLSFHLGRDRTKYVRIPGGRIPVFGIFIVSILLGIVATFVVKDLKDRQRSEHMRATTIEENPGDSAAMK